MQRRYVVLGLAVVAALAVATLGFNVVATQGLNRDATTCPGNEQLQLDVKFICCLDSTPVIDQSNSQVVVALN